MHPSLIASLRLKEGSKLKKGCRGFAGVLRGFCVGFCTFSRLSELLVKQTGGYKKRKKREKVFVLGVREKSKSTTSMLIISLLGAEVTSGRGKRENGEKNEGACAPS